MDQTTSLVAFTLLAQAGIGVVLAALLTGAPTGPTAAAFRLALPLTALGLALAFAHLGRPFRAPRALANLRDSWLSRECLALAGFLALAGARAWLGGAALAWLATAAGALALASMASIYGRTAIPAWGPGRAQAAFWTAALALGGFAMALLAPGARPLALVAAAVAAQVIATALHLAALGSGPAAARAGLRRARRPLAAGLALSALGGLGFPALALAAPALAAGHGLPLAGLLLAGLLLILGQVLVRHAFFASAVHPMAAGWADLPPAEFRRGRP
jgi:anaerobic dimethyl sulfoxide reductase subunit C (anchor subunit)